MTSERREKAREILRSLAGDVDLVPEDLREWWSNYLGFHEERYLTSLGYLGPSGGTVLEIGSAPGQFTALVSLMGYEVCGIDLDPERFGPFWRRYGLDVRKADVETDFLPFADDTFDAVVFTEVLEHLRINPLHTFRELGRVMKPSGRMIVSTPNITPSHRLMFLFGKNYVGNLAQEFKKLETLGHMGHARLWSQQDLRDFLNEVGGLEISSYNLEGGYVRGGWKTSLLRMIHPVKKRFRRHAYFVVRKGDRSPDLSH